MSDVRNPQQFLPEGHRVHSFDSVVSVKGLSGRSKHRSKVWVVLGPAEGDDPDDRTQPEASHRYLSYGGLRAAVDSGEAWLPGHPK